MFFNFRQLPHRPAQDGKTFRSSLFYRTGACAEPFTEADRLRLTTAGIKAYVDLRTTPELPMNSLAPVIESTGARYVHLPVMGYHTSAAALDLSDAPPATEAYLAVAALNREAFLRFFRALASAEPPLPLLFGCVGGKDRTGILAAFLFLLAGVRDDDIADDYASSAQAFSGASRGASPGAEDNAAACKLWPEQSVMLLFLESFRGRWASIENYLSTADGLSLKQIDQLKALVVQ